MSQRTEATIVVDCGAMEQLKANERHKVNVLLRRMRHLHIRFTENPLLSWDLAEYAALHWTLEKLGIIQPLPEAPAE